MRCVEIEALLSDYADGIAVERERRIVERHLQLCDECRDGVLLGRRLGQQLTRLSLLPIGVLDRVPRMRTRLEKQLNRRRPGRDAIAVRALLALIVGVLGVLLLILVVNVAI